MINVVKTIIRDLLYLFTNYFVAYIPVWWLRKIFYIILGMKIGKGTRICMKCIIMSPWKVTIGKNTMVNEFVLLDGRGGLKIGDNCSLSMWSVVYTASHSSKSSDFSYYSKPTEIKNCCWIGTRAVVMPGSILNDRTIVSVNSVLKGITEKGGVYIGNPAEKKYKRDLKIDYEQFILDFFK